MTDETNEALTKDEATLDDFKGAMVRTYADEYGYGPLTPGTDTPGVTPSYAWAQPIYGEAAHGDWSGTMHDPHRGIKATNIHVSDAWVLEQLTAQYGACYRVLDSDIHFFTFKAEDYLRAWIQSLPSPQEKPPQSVLIAGYPYGVRSGTPKTAIGEYSGVGHIAGREDCHWYNRFADPNAGGKSGSPCFDASKELTDDSKPFGINVARGYIWEGEGINPHWAVVQCYHRAMQITAAK